MLRLTRALAGLRHPDDSLWATRIARIATLSAVVDVHAGQAIVEQGSPVSALHSFIVLAGSVVLTIDDRSADAPCQVANLAQSDIFADFNPPPGWSPDGAIAARASFSATAGPAGACLSIAPLELLAEVLGDYSFGQLL